MNRNSLQAFISGFLLVLIIVVLPNQFLFSKEVPNSFWTEYFPLPFGAGWFLTCIASIPVAWFIASYKESVIYSLVTTLFVTAGAVPIAIVKVGGSFSLNGLINQYLWVAIILMPPVIVHLLIRWAFSSFKGKWLTRPSI